MTGFLLLLAMGTVAWYAWPAAPGFAIKVWTIVFAVFLAPFSWPWLVARGHRARKANAKAAAEQRQRDAETQRGSSIRWWFDELEMAVERDDLTRAELAHEVLVAMGAQDWTRMHMLNGRLNAMRRRASYPS